MVQRRGVARAKPEAKITASATEGLAPLRIEFASARPGGQAQWDFGDGATSQETKPAHLFRKPGLYSVKLTVTDAEGGSAQTYQAIAVEPEGNEPLVRVGLPEGKEMPAVKLHGTAQRTTNGSFHLPEGAPWGWVQVGNGALEDVGVLGVVGGRWIRVPQIEH